MMRRTFLRLALERLGTWYVYGGRSWDIGTDCFGLIALASDDAGGPDFKMWWTDRAWQKWEPITAEDMLPGDCIFYGGDPRNPGDVGHVAILLNELGMVLEAGGGDQSTKTVAEAKRCNARVRIKEHYLYRKDVRGFRRLPVTEEDLSHA